MSWAGIKRVLVGVEHDPQVVAWARAVAYFLAPVIIDAALHWLAGVNNPTVLILAPTLSGFLRALEGAIDRQLKPEQNAVNPPPVAGGGDSQLRG